MALAIKVENVSKAYQLGEIGTGTLAWDIQRWYARVRGKEDPFMKIGETNDRSVKGKGNIVWSLKDINFDIEEGDAVGIIGRNGAGKSTLLKLLSRVTSPSTGSIKLRGRIASLLEVGTGFHPELTGRENIFLNGAILGMRKKEIAKKFDEIVDFSGVERYIDTPVKRYSSGMYVRLAFAVSAYLESEILIVDEVLAVGDAEFQKKCLGKMGDVSKGEGRTILFVSHNMGAIQQLCKKTIILTHGLLSVYGYTREAIGNYLSNQNNNSEIYRGSATSQKSIWFREIFLSKQNGQVTNEFFHDEVLIINYELQFNIDREKHDYSIFCMILDHAKNRVFATESRVIRTERLKLYVEDNFMVRGSYSIHTFIHKSRTEQIDVAEDVCNFSIIDNGSFLNIHADYDYGRVFGRTSWEDIF